MNKLRILLGVAAAGSAVAAHAKSVNSPTELGATDFFAYVESPNGSYPYTFERGPAPVGIALTDPVFAGAALTGQVTVSNATTRTGPTTTVNAVLDYSGPLTGVIDVDLASLVTFDLALFGPAGGPAAVRVLGRGIGGAAGNVTGQFGSARATVSGFVTLYETDAAGNPVLNSNTLTWSIPGNFADTPIDEVIQLDRNELYKVIVRSTAGINANNIDAFTLSAYMIVDPVFESLTEGVTAAVSPGASPVPLPGAAWLLGSALAAGGACLGRRQRRDPS